MTTSTSAPSATSVSNRHAVLQAAAGRLRARAGANLPVEQILLGLAAVLIPLGLVFILLGWDGAAHNGHTYAQISYLISGGIFGLGLAVLGCFMYFGYWLSRQLGESRRQSALTQQSLKRIEELLDAQVGYAATAASNGSGPALLFATPRGNLLHRPECPVVSKRSDLRSIPAGTDGFGYCTMCDAAGVLT
jgi:hypothetical protein